MTKQLRIILFILLVAPASFAGETIPTIVPMYKLTPRPAPDPSEIHSRWTGAHDVVTWWLNLWGEQSIKEQVKAAIESQILKQKEVLEWTGNGALLNMRVIRADKTEGGLRPLAIPGEGALVLGYGKSPDDVLFDYWKTQWVEVGVPQGWTVDRVMSAYVWVENRDGQIIRNGVPEGTMINLNKRVKENFPSMLKERLEKKLNNLQAWQRVADTAKSRILDRAAKEAIDKSLRAVTESQKRVFEINRTLKEALVQEHKAGEAVIFIRTLQAILTVAELANRAGEMLGENPDVFSNTTSAQAVIQKSEEIQEKRRQFSLSLKAEFDGGIVDLNKFLRRLWTEVQPANPPDVIKNDLNVGPRVP
ncbi:MAG: hypothetical protein WBO24_17760 [Nitrospirales bacterium]